MRVAPFHRPIAPVPGLQRFSRETNEPAGPGLDKCVDIAYRSIVWAVYCPIAPRPTAVSRRFVDNLIVALTLGETDAPYR